MYFYQIPTKVTKEQDFVEQRQLSVNVHYFHISVETCAKLTLVERAMQNRQ